MNTFKKLDNFSKLIIISVVIILIYLFYGQINLRFFQTESKPSAFSRIQSDFDLSVESWEFGAGFRERLLIDDYLEIKLKKPITEDSFKALTFEIKPQDEIKTELFNSKTIRITFKNKMKLNNDVYTILILKDSKLVYKIVFNNTTYNEEFFKSLR